MLYTFDISKNKQRFLNLVNENVHRTGIDKLLKWLVNDTDFFTAPCSTKYHLNVKGGLCLHSLNVYDMLLKLCVVNDIEVHSCAETLTIVSLFHDLCKTNFYKEELVSQKINGHWTQAPGYVIEDGFPFGHGEKSVYLIEKHMRLTVEEALSIRWHMGAFDDAAKLNLMQLGQAQDKSVLVTLLHCADLLSTRVTEARYA